MSRRFATRNLAAGALLLVTAAGGTVAATLPSAAVSDIPRVDLSTMPERIRSRVETLQGRIAELQAEEADPGLVAAAWGALGRAYLAYEYHDAARRCFGRAAELDPAVPAWPYYLGMVAAAVGELDVAAARFGEVLERAPDDLATLLRLARVETERGELAAATALYRRALAAAPEVAAGHAGLGAVAALEGDPGAAVRHLERALELLPGASALHYQLAQQYRRLGDEDAARRHLALRGDQVPGFPDPLGRAIELERVETAFDVVRELAAETGRLPIGDVIGFALAQFGDLEGAIRAFERSAAEAAKDHDPTPVATRARLEFVLGALYARKGEAEAALAHYQAALAADPDLAEVRGAMAWALRRLGREAEARQVLDEALRRDPEDPVALLRRADLLAETGEVEAALLDLDRLAEVAPDRARSAEVQLRRAELLAERGSRPEAIAAYRRALDLPMAEADRALAERRLGGLLVVSGEPRQALAHYRSAVERDPGFHRARVELAALLLRLGEAEEAQRLFATARQQDPEDANAYLGEASAALMLGRHGAAREALAAGIGEVPGEPRLQGMLARVLASAPDPAVRDGERALALARPLAATDPSFLHRETLAMALAAAGRYDEAVTLQSTLVEEARAAGDAAVAAGLAATLELYRADRPCCGSEERRQ